MQKHVHLDWDGKDVWEGIVKGALSGMDIATSMLAGITRGEAPVRTGRLRGSITTQPARLVGTKVIGAFGSPINDPRYPYWVHQGRKKYRDKGNRFVRRAFKSGREEAITTMVDSMKRSGNG